MTTGTNTQVSVTNKLAGFASNALDISAPQNPFDLLKLTSTTRGYGNIASMFLSPALQLLADDNSANEMLATKKEDEIHIKLVMSLEQVQLRRVEMQRAIEEAEEKSRERNSSRASRKSENKSERPDTVTQSSRTDNKTVARDNDDDRPRLKRTFNREAPGIVDRALETADRAVTETVKVARRTAGDAVEATADAVGLDGKAARRVARDTVDGATTAVGTAFKVAANPVGAAIEYGAPAAKAVGNAAYNAASSGYNWLFGK